MLDPKWMMRRRKHEIGLKRGIYKRIKNGETHPRNRYAELVRSVKRNTRSAKRNYEIRVAREAKKDPKRFFQTHRTKVREKIGPLKTDTGDVIDDKEGMSKLLNNYFRSVFTQENLSTLPEGVQVYEGNDNDRLRDVTITRQIIQEEIDKLKKNKSKGKKKKKGS